MKLKSKVFVPESSGSFVANFMIVFSPGPAAFTALIHTSYTSPGLRASNLWVRALKLYTGGRDCSQSGNRSKHREDLDGGFTARLLPTLICILVFTYSNLVILHYPILLGNGNGLPLKVHLTVAQRTHFEWRHPRRHWEVGLESMTLGIHPLRVKTTSSRSTDLFAQSIPMLTKCDGLHRWRTKRTMILGTLCSF